MTKQTKNFLKIKHPSRLDKLKNFWYNEIKNNKGAFMK